MIDHIFNTYDAMVIFCGFMFALLLGLLVLQLVCKVIIWWCEWRMSSKQLGDHPVKVCGVEPETPWPRIANNNKGNGVIIPFSRLQSLRAAKNTRKLREFG